MILNLEIFVKGSIKGFMKFWSNPYKIIVLP